MKILRFLSFAALAFLLTQCYPEGPVYTEDLDVVYTNYDPEYNFGEKLTFAMPDKIMKIDDDLMNGTGINYVKDIYASVMLDRIQQNLIANGWTQRKIDENPDVLIAPAAFELTTYYSNDYWGYWDWWYDGYYPDGGWYYPYPVVSSYSTGSLIVMMVDPNDLTASDRPRVAWTFAVNGLLQGSTDQFNARTAKGINQAFTQSEYLKK